MKRLPETLKLSLACVIGLIIVSFLCGLVGAIIMTVASIFISSVKLIITIGFVGYIVMAGVIVFYVLKWYIKRNIKNSQEDTRE